VDSADSAANDSIDALPKPAQAGQRQRGASDANRSVASLNTPRSARISKKAPSSPTPAHLTRRATRLSGASTENLAIKLSTLSKRGKKAVEKGASRISRELMRLKDTNEFAHIDTRPVRYTVWSNGKYIEVDPTQETPAPEPPRKKVKVDENAAGGNDKAEAEKPEPSAPVAKKRGKKWLEKGLYAGQEAPIDIFKGLTAQEKKKLASIPELMPSGKPNRTLPQPMYNGLRVLINGRDFKLPFDVCNPLPPGQPKPAAYRTMTKSESSQTRCGPPVPCANLLSRPICWQRSGVLEEDAPFRRLRLEVCLQGRRRVRRGLPEPHHAVRVRRHELQCRQGPLPEPRLSGPAGTHQEGWPVSRGRGGRQDG
jgi:histone-lysine N-methyltransferase ASH1L